MNKYLVKYKCIYRNGNVSENEIKLLVKDDVVDLKKHIEDVLEEHIKKEMNMPDALCLYEVWENTNIKGYYIVWKN